MTGDTKDEVQPLLDSVRLAALRKMNDILSLPASAKPPRHATAILHACRLALDFTQAKPAQAVDVNAQVSATLKIEVENVG